MSQPENPQQPDPQQPEQIQPEQAQPAPYQPEQVPPAPYQPETVQPEPYQPASYQPTPMHAPTPQYQPEPTQAPVAYDPNAQAAYDPNAQAAYDANAQAAYDPNAQAAYDPNAQAAYDPNAQAAYDPNAQAAYDPNAQAAYDPNAYPGAAPAAYPGAVTQDPNAYPGAAPAAYPGATASAAPQGYPAAYPAAGFAPAPKKPVSKGLLFGLIGGGAVVVLGIAAAVIVPIVTRPPALSASEYVENYLTALSEGDAEAALALVENYGEDDSLLTDDVLAASLKLGAIDDIEVGEQTDGDYGDFVVPATFTIGDTTVDRTFTVNPSYEGDSMTITDGLTSFSGLYGFEGLGLTVNGVEAPSDYTYVFPGTYEFAVGLDQFAIDGASTVVLADDDDAEALYDVRPTLSDAGATAFRDLVKASFAECLAMKTLDTPCGMNTSDMSQDGYTPIDGTVTRTIDAENQSKIDNLVPEVSERAIVTTWDSWYVDITLEGTNGSSRAQFEVLFGGRVLSPKVDFAAETPAVIWE